MEYVNVKGESVPALGFGTWQSTGQTCEDAVRHALQLGYRHIDTAQAYENEEKVGKAIYHSGVDRDELFLTTKVWRTNMRKDDVIASTEESLRKLDTEYVDLLLLHWPVDEVPFEESIDGLLELREQQKIRHFGVSNFLPEQVEQVLEKTPIFAHQCEYHPFLDQSELVEQARSNDFMFTAYSPLARGGVLQSDILQEIGDDYGKSPAQVSLRWLVQQDNVSAIPKANSPHHRKENFKIFDFELSDEEMGQISDLARPDGRVIDPSFAPDW